MRDVRIPDRLPRDELTGNVVDDFGVPFDAGVCRPARNPVRSPSAHLGDRLEMLEKAGKILEVAPEVVKLARRPADDYRTLDLDGLPRVHRSCRAPDIGAMSVVARRQPGKAAIL